MAETKLIRDHHLLTRNLKLNSNAITNDGVAGKGLTIANDGATTILSDTVNDDILKLEADSVIGGNALLVEMGDTSTGQANKSMCNLNFAKTGVTSGPAGPPTINQTTGFNITMTDEADNGSNALVWLTGVYLDLSADHGGDLTVQTGFDIEIDKDNNTDPDACTGIKSTVNNGGSDIKMFSSTSTLDYCKIRTDANGETYIQTTDSGGGVLAHINLIADGNVEIKCNPGGTIKVLENDDTTFSPSDAADIATKAYVDAQTHLILIDENNFTTDSATQPPSQQSTKAYIASELLASRATSSATAESFSIAMAIALG